MTFREEAAVRLMASMMGDRSAWSDSHDTMGHAAVYAKTSVIVASVLAQAACAEWGHDHHKSLFSPGHSFDCARCGESGVYPFVQPDQVRR